MNLDQDRIIAGLDQLRKRMGAPLIPFDSGVTWRPIDPIDDEGIDVPPGDIDINPDDGTTEYQGRRVAVYIRDQTGH